MESLTLRASTAAAAAASPLQQRRFPGRQRATYVRATASASAAGEPDLSVRVNGLQMPNPFVIGSGPPGTNYTVMKRAFDEGWGGVIAKTVSRSPSPLTGVAVSPVVLLAWLRHKVGTHFFLSESVIVTVHLCTICGRSVNSLRSRK